MRNYFDTQTTINIFNGTLLCSYPVSLQASSGSHVRHIFGVREASKANRAARTRPQLGELACRLVYLSAGDLEISVRGLLAVTVVVIV